MRRFPAFIASICFVLLGTGALEYLHNLEHEREDAAQMAIARVAGKPVQEAPRHDDSNCSVHAQLHLPTLPAAWVPLLICLGVFVAFMTELAPALAPQRAWLHIDCRGPPAC